MAEDSVDDTTKKLHQEIERLQNVVKRQGQENKVIASIPPKLEHEDFFAIPYNASILAQILTEDYCCSSSSTGGGDKNNQHQQKHYRRPPPPFRTSDYESVPSAANGAVKEEINRFMVELLTATDIVYNDNIETSHSPFSNNAGVGNGRLEAWSRDDPARNIILLIDSPKFLSTLTLLKKFPSLSPHQICIPQYDRQHYTKMINSTILRDTSEQLSVNNEEEIDPALLNRQFLLPNIRCQRLDHWLITNRGLKCAYFFADMEGSILGHKAKRLSPAKDIMRYFRYKYPIHGSILGLTYDPRRNDYNIGKDEIVEFVLTEATIHGYAQTQCVRSWSYGMGCLVFIVRH